MICKKKFRSDALRSGFLEGQIRHSIHHHVSKNNYSGLYLEKQFNSSTVQQSNTLTTQQFNYSTVEKLLKK
jgi:hypothetical protein